MEILNKSALVLVIIGALNWLTIGFFQYDIVGMFFGGQNAAFSRIIFALVGLAGIWTIGLLFKNKMPSTTH